MDITNELGAIRVEANRVATINTESMSRLAKEFTEISITSIQTYANNAAGYIAAVRDKECNLTVEHVKGAVQIGLESLNSAAENYLKMLGDAKLKAIQSVWEQQDKAVALINQGLAAIEEATLAATAAIRAEVDAGRQDVRTVADSEEAHLMTFAKEFEIALNLKEKRATKI